jgi:acyl carrier protein
MRNKEIEVEVNENSSLTDDLYLDSLDKAESLFEMEKSFSIEISNEEAMKFQTVKDVIDLIQAKTNKQ